MFQKVRVSERDFSLDEEAAELLAATNGTGAICSFTGYVRDFSAGAGAGTESAVHSIVLEHYPSMTEKALNKFIHTASERWALNGVILIHRVGELKASERIVLVMVASQHRGDAFAACEFLMDYLKSQAPFWKKEMGSSTAEWVEAKESDQERARRW